MLWSCFPSKKVAWQPVIPAFQPVKLSGSPPTSSSWWLTSKLAKELHVNSPILMVQAWTEVLNLALNPDGSHQTFSLRSWDRWWNIGLGMFLTFVWVILNLRVVANYNQSFNIQTSFSIGSQNIM
jgi:hypothetical protein